MGLLPSAPTADPSRPARAKPALLLLFLLGLRGLERDLRRGGLREVARVVSHHRPGRLQRLLLLDHPASRLRELDVHRQLRAWGHREPLPAELQDLRLLP